MPDTPPGETSEPGSEPSGADPVVPDGPETDPAPEPDPGSPPGDLEAPAAPLTRAGRRAVERAARKRHRRRTVITVVAVVVGLVLLVSGAGFGVYQYETHRFHRIVVKHLVTVKTTGAQADVRNILLIGSTDRCALTKQNPIFGLCSQGVNGVNSDVVMILHLDPDHHRAAILSIPRDTFIPNARGAGSNKIDAALGDPGGNGPSQLTDAIEQDFGIPITDFVELNFDTFQGVVTDLGGLNMYFPMPVYDSYSQLKVYSAGCQAVNGAEALAVVRARHLQYQPPADAGVPPYNWPADPQSDLSRIRRDHEFLRVLAAAVAKKGLGNPITDLSLVNSVAPNLVVDTGFSPSDMAGLVLAFHAMNPDQVPTYTLPVVVDEAGQYYYRGSGYGDIVFPIQPQDSQVVARFLGVGPGQDADGKPLPAPSTFTVAVENGSAVFDAGSQTAASLRAAGYTVTSVTDTPEGAPTTETVVLYSDPSQLEAALQVQQSLAGLAVLGYDPGLTIATTSGTPGKTKPTIDVGSPLPASEIGTVVVVLGSNFAVNPAPGTTPSNTTTTGGSTTSSTTTSSTTTSSTTPSSRPGPGATTTTSTTVSPTLADNPNLVAPSPPTENLQPWDPRSCTASGGEGP